MAKLSSKVPEKKAPAKAKVVASDDVLTTAKSAEKGSLVNTIKILDDK